MFLKNLENTFWDSLKKHLPKSYSLENQRAIVGDITNFVQIFPFISVFSVVFQQILGTIVIKEERGHKAS